ncbi:MAG: hypothetical protein EHM33_02075 [Chloroflexi bacterium]|nr:MAG: hypothetical protein EHM33_02075 [Chloroflexota bacterium]
MTNTLLPPPLPIAEAIERDVTTDPRLKSVHSIRQYRSDLLHFEAWRNGRALTKSLVEDYAAALHREGYAPASINQRLAAVRWWVRRLIDHAEDDLEDTPKTRKEIRRASRVLIVRGVTGQRPPRGRYLSPEEIKSLLDVCASDPAPAGARDGAMFAVALSVGLRQGDITSLQMEDIRNNTGESCDLVVHGKGDRVDTLYLYKGGTSASWHGLHCAGRTPATSFAPSARTIR